MRALRRSAAAIAGAMACIVAIVLAVIGWRSARAAGLEHDPLLASDRVLITAVAAGVILLVGVAVGVTARPDDGPRKAGLGPASFFLVAAAFVAWYAVRSIRVICLARDDLMLGGASTPFVIYQAAFAAALIGVVFAAATVLRGGRTPLTPRHASAVAVVAALLLTGGAGWWIGRASARAWEPGLTSPPAPIAPLPDTLGTERYRVATGVFTNDQVIAAGNGFVVTSVGSVVGYDGVSGARRWEVADLGGDGSSAVTWRDPADGTGIVVFGRGQAVVALDAGTGRTLWSRRMPGRVERVVGGREALGVVVRVDGVASFSALDPATGYTLWTSVTTAYYPGAPGQFREGESDGAAIDVRTRERSEGVAGGRLLPDGNYWMAATRTVVDRTGRLVDRFPDAVLEGARYYTVLGSGHGSVLFVVDVGEAWRVAVRDVLTHRDVQVPPPAAGQWYAGDWIGRRLLLRSTVGASVLFDPDTGRMEQAVAPRCVGESGPGRYLGVPGATLAVCGRSGSIELVGLA